jgi:O-antigen/teichoic acid export membrane protein
MISIKETFSQQGFKKYLRNTTWMFLTYGLRLFTGFFVGLWLARYLGPRDYGIYNYVISLTMIFVTIATFGTTEIILKKILHDSDNDESLKSGFDLRMGLSVILFLGLGLYAYFFEPSQEVQFYILISSFALFFQPFEVVDSYFRAKVQAEKSSIGRMLQLAVSSVAKILLIVSGSPLKWFYLVFVFDAIFYAALVMTAYLKSNPNFLPQKIKMDSIKEIARESYPLMIIAVSSLMLARFDQVIIGQMLTKYDVGLYSAASKTIEIGTLFSVLISLSLYPAILNAKKAGVEVYLRRMAMLNRLLVGGGVVLSAGVFFFAAPIIKLLFGDKFSASADIMKVLSFNILFISFYQVSYRWYLSENLQSLMMKKTLAAVIVNIGMNFVLIPRFGILGAAYSSIITSLIFHFLFEALFKRTRECFKINTSFLRI